jgi:FkbM family methyltransferase
MKQLVQSVLKKFGYQLTRVDGSLKPAYGLDSFFSLIKQFGFSPRHIVDIGANRGMWTRKAIQFFPDAYYTLVEPQDHLKMYVEDLIDRGYKISWIHAGAGDESGSLPFTIRERDDSSTFLSSPQAPDCSQVTAPVKTINEIVSSSGAPLPGMVKIDAEGFDLKALSGASDLFGKTDIFLVEAGICPATHFENSAFAVMRRMADVGYQLIDVTDINRSPEYGVLWLCELAFLRESSRLLDAVTSYE